MLNSVLSGISLDGKRYFYTNPLRLSADLPYTLRWPKERQEYISCFCCPPNTLRTLCEAQNYAYTVGEKTLYCQFYGASEVTAVVPGVGEVTLRQETDYPWDGHIRLTLVKLPKKARKTAWTLACRIPSWTGLTDTGNGYRRETRVWKQGDTLSIDLPMEARLMEAHPLAEEIRNQVAVQRGPLVYCLEQCDLPEGVKLDDVLIPADISLKPVETRIAGSRIMALEGEALVTTGAASRSDASASSSDWSNRLYRPLQPATRPVRIRLIPYYAWGNRGRCDMTVWLPLSR
jgi:DUF1680 family protein